jgi:hypothetical protein
MLAPTVIQSARPKGAKRKKPARPGYVDQNGQTYSVPASAKRVDSWKKKMIEAGHIF